MNTLERTVFRAIHENDFASRVMLIAALFTFILALVVIVVNAHRPHQSAGGGASSGSGTVVQPIVRPGHPSSTGRQKPMTECERDALERDVDPVRCR